MSKSLKHLLYNNLSYNKSIFLRNNIIAMKLHRVLSPGNKNVELFDCAQLYRWSILKGAKSRQSRNLSETVDRFRPSETYVKSFCTRFDLGTRREMTSRLICGT